MQFVSKSKTTLAFMLAFLAVGAVQAGTTGAEFLPLFTLVTDWASGYLGKSLAIIAFLFGAGVGVAKQTVIPAVMGLVFAVVFAIGPSVITGMLSAVI